MKYLILFISLWTCFSLFAEERSISGIVSSPGGCSKKVMVWLSLDKSIYSERLLLMHTEVPVGGTFQFFVRPGNYQVRASDETGCEYFQKVAVQKADSNLQIKLVKK